MTIRFSALAPIGMADSAKMTIRLSANGQEPATHLGMSSKATAQEIADIKASGAVVLLSEGVSVADQFAALLEQNSLRRILGEVVA